MIQIYTAGKINSFFNFSAHLENLIFYLEIFLLGLFLIKSVVYQLTPKTRDNFYIV